MTSKTYAGIHGDAHGRQVVLDYFPSAEIVEQGGRYFLWEPSLTGLEGRPFEARATAIFRQAREAATLLRDEDVSLGAYAKNLRISTDGDRDVVEWAPIVASVNVQLADDMLVARGTVGAPTVEPGPVAVPKPNRDVERLARMEDEQPRFAAAQQLLVSSDSSELNLRQAKEHIITGLLDRGMPRGAPAITAAFTELSGIDADRIDRMQDTIDHHWIHVNKAQRFPDPLSYAEVRTILRAIMNGWLERDQQVSLG